VFPHTPFQRAVFPAAGFSCASLTSRGTGTPPTTLIDPTY
jgi:hypothetical protein